MTQHKDNNIATPHMTGPNRIDGAAADTWFRGEQTNFTPRLKTLLRTKAVEEFVLKGWLPKKPYITPETQITAFGSCFATNISKYLAKRNFRVINKDREGSKAYVVSFSEGILNTFVMRQQFEWAWEGKVFEQLLWHSADGQEHGYDDEVREETRNIFNTTDVFILTIGLSEVWYDRDNGDVFWRTIPKEDYDPKRHAFKMSTTEENRENLRAIYQLIRKHRPEAKIIFSLSPIPLIATFRDNSCITSNSVSKATLRVAIDEVLQEFKGDGYLHYWPSYELITDVFRSAFRDDLRHVYPAILYYIMVLFEHQWCISEDGSPAPSLENAWARALATAGILPPQMARAILERRPRLLRALLDNEKQPLHETPAVARAMNALGRSLLEDWTRLQKDADREGALSAMFATK